MKKDLIRLVCCLLLLLSFQSAISKSYSDMEKLRKLFTEQVMSSTVNKEKINGLLRSIQPDGTWPGIDYIDVSLTGFQHGQHLDNTLALAIAYKKNNSPYKGKKEIKQAIDKVLIFWLENDFIGENWYSNEIATPDKMASLLLLLDKELTTKQSDKMLEIAGRGNINSQGARPSGDRIRIAGIQARIALYKQNEMELRMLLQVIEGEIKFSTERGMQHDYSFHHREDWVNNTLAYGAAYADTFAEWAANLEGTSYRFSEKSVKMLVDYYLDGICKQMIYGKITDPAVLNREISRPYENGYVWGTKTLERLLSVTNYRQQELENIINARQGKGIEPTSFAKSFWRSDHFVIERPNFHTSVRMHSSRNCNIEEPHNHEGLMNHFRGDGSNYISVEGDEYNSLTPVCDWMKIPGTTIVQLDSMPPAAEIQKWGMSDFSGAVTDGMYGAAAFNFRSPHTNLLAKKSWFFFDEEYICLGSDITYRKNRAVVTTVNQCLLSGDVWVKDNTGVHIQDEGSRKLDDVQWVFHDQVGYIFPKNTSVSLSNQEELGSWVRTSKSAGIPKDEVRKDVFSLWINHGTWAWKTNYEYIVIPGIDKGKMEKYDCPITVISNTAELQAVRHNKLNIAYAVFYKNGTAHITNDLSIRLESPGLLMVKYNEVGEILSIAVSDPTHLLEKMHLSINSKMPTLQQDTIKMIWNNETSTTLISIDLPQNEYAGMSVVYNK